MMASLVLYGFAALALLGGVSMLRPIRLLGIRNRWWALLALLAGVAGVFDGLDRTALADYVTTAASGLDEFMPIYQFSETYSIPVHAPAARVYDAVFAVSADEIPFYRTLVWLRRGMTTGGRESVLNPPDGVPLITVARRTSFVKLAETPDREFVMGTVVLAPPGVRLALGLDPDSFRSLDQEGFAKAAMSFTVEPIDRGWTLLRTETRVFATDPDSRDRFARYWRVIAPGSALIRQMWLRAIKVRAEAPAR